MELIQILNAGAVAGLAAGGMIGLFSLIFIHPRINADSPWRPLTGQRHVLMLLLHLLAGLGLGLLFWLSWGLTAIVGVTWWQRGLAFAMITWAVACAPFCLSAPLMQRWPWRAALGLLGEWLCTFLLVGLACAWSWAKEM